MEPDTSYGIAYDEGGGLSKQVCKLLLFVKQGCWLQGGEVNEVGTSFRNYP